jgi:hypothetical protein
MSFRKLNSEHLQDLEFLVNLSADCMPLYFSLLITLQTNELTHLCFCMLTDVTEFCKIAIDFIINGGSGQKKLFAAAAKRLSCSKEDVQRTVTSLSYLFTECAKSNLDTQKLEYMLTVDSAKWQENDPRIPIISKCYEENRAQLRNLFLKVDSTETCFGISTIPQYKDCEWRLDMECDRRSLMNGNAELKPTYMIHLVTNQENKDFNFQMSYDDLKHVTDMLGEALKELKTVHVRRIRHYIH